MQPDSASQSSIRRYTKLALRTGGPPQISSPVYKRAVQRSAFSMLSKNVRRTASPSGINFLLLCCLLEYATAATWPYLYPECAQAPMEASVPSSCSIDDAVCLCGSTEFWTDSAQAVWQACGCSVLEQMAQQGELYCSTEIPLTADAIIAAGDGGQASCSGSGTSGTSTTSISGGARSSSTANSSGGNAAGGSGGGSNSNNVVNNSGGSGSGGISTHTQVILGVVFPVVTLVVMFLTWWFPCERGRRPNPRDWRISCIQYHHHNHF